MMGSKAVEHRCEICRRTEHLGRHLTERLVRGERSCNAAAEDAQGSWIYLCGLCHGSVHRVIESTPDISGIQSDAVEQVLARVERAFLGSPRGKRRATQANINRKRTES